jgi:hypothetical protein
VRDTTILRPFEKNLKKILAIDMKMTQGVVLGHGNLAGGIGNLLKTSGWLPE